MKKPKITDGKWKHGVINNGHEHFKDYSHYVSVPENEMVLCDILENHSFEESGYNAKAISAVPEMIDTLISNLNVLEATHLFLTSNKNYDKIDLSGLKDEIRQTKKALKKAGCV